MDELATITRLCILCWFFVRAAASRKALISEVLIGERFDCPLASKRVYTVKSELQCTHQCLQNDSCELVNYNTDKMSNENCEILMQANQCTNTLWENNWVAMIFKRQRPPKVYKSCNEIYSDNPSSATGVYEIDSGRHFCIMEDSTGPCGVGGWTLALKVNGTKNTFLSTSSYWTNDETYNIENGIKSLYEDEAKFPAFSKVAFNDICIGMKVSSNVRWLRIPGINKASLLSLFETGNAFYTNIARSSWKSLIDSSSLQLNCNRQGFNVKDSANSIWLRLGYIANQENDCATCDSYIGIGPSRFPVSCGNIAAIQTDNGDRNTPALCYVLVQ